MIGKEYNALYLLNQAQLFQHQDQVHSSMINSCASDVSKAVLWHHRFGHIPSPVLQMLHLMVFIQIILLVIVVS